MGIKTISNKTRKMKKRVAAKKYTDGLFSIRMLDLEN